MIAKTNMAQARTFFVGYLLIRGAMRMEPTHWKAWLSPVKTPTRWKVIEMCVVFSNSS
jgi:hypothetical protein